MRPYGEKIGSRARYVSRQQQTPWGIFIRLSLDEWKIIKRQPKKAARQAAKNEIREATA
jgi:hypothetical protein